MTKMVTFWYGYFTTIKKIVKKNCKEKVLCVCRTFEDGPPTTHLWFPKRLPRARPRTSSFHSGNKLEKRGGLRLADETEVPEPGRGGAAFANPAGLSLILRSTAGTG